jgi:hypothetical protein
MVFVRTWKADSMAQLRRAKEGQKIYPVPLKVVQELSLLVVQVELRNVRAKEQLVVAGEVVHGFGREVLVVVEEAVVDP